MKNILKTTYSLCPICKKKIKSTIFEENNIVYIEKTCSEHGYFKDIYFSDYELYKRFKKFATERVIRLKNPQIENNEDGSKCPFSCGLCKYHKSHTALLNVVLTNRCNLRCWYCFFYAKPGDKIYEPTIEQIKEILLNAKNEKPIGCNAVQFTGGEPTLREDLFDIIKMAREIGYDHIQLNTNGIKLKDENYVKELAKAGVSTIYMSFDGVSEKTNPKNYKEIPDIIENCRKYCLGLVLVPTVIKDVNLDEVWEIIKFALDNIDVVRGVNFQPVSFVGSMPKKLVISQRVTIPDVINKLAEQSNGILTKYDFYPVPIVSLLSDVIELLIDTPVYNFTNHFACGAATYLIKDGDEVHPITYYINVDSMFEYFKEIRENLAKNESKIGKTIELGKLILKLKDFVKRNPKEFNLVEILRDIFVFRNYEKLGKFHMNTLFVGMMHFMDPFNYDIERVQRCTIHYGVPDGKIIPFCTFNVLPEIYRDKIQEKYSITQEEWEKRYNKKLTFDVYREIKEN